MDRLQAKLGGNDFQVVALSLGLGLPFRLTAWFTNQFLAHLKRLRRWSRAIHIGAGIILILMGVAMVTGQLTDSAWWLLEVFPILGRIG
ncbi:cytochrome c biogenesis protein CcdA [Pseudomonas sp. GCM10022186]|uniref:cytochrome c biogenesis protein CcdA n=1 Tax=Pseudomonas sp. GCM10022186 TaxID=3252650 RepID=UPI00360969FF